MKKNSYSLISVIKKMWKSKLLMTMRLTLFVVIVCMTQVFAASTYSQETRMSLNLKNTSLRSVLGQIEDQSEFYFIYNAKAIDVDKKVSVEFENKPIIEILDKLFAGANVDYKIDKRQILLSTNSDINSAQQKISISGKVTDSSGFPLPGATVVVKGTIQGAITDGDGNYSLSNAPGNATLVFSFVGMRIQEVSIVGKSIIDVVMEEDAIGVGEVIVTALGIEQKKKSLGYAVTNVDGEALSTAKESNMINSISGKVAGVVVSPASSGMGGSSRVIIRGNSSIGGNNQPLYVVDGIPISNKGFGYASENSAEIGFRSDYGTGISDINPNDIESISVLKGPNAAALYGSRAANGVILITTKIGKGKKGIGISISSNVMVNTINESTMPDFQNEYGQGNNGILNNTSIQSYGAKLDGSEYTNAAGETRKYSPQPNNVTDFFKTGIVSTQSIALMGSRENATVNFSYTNSSETGIVPNASAQRHNFNLRTTVDLSDKLSLDAKVTYFTQQGKQRLVMGWSDYSNVIDLLYKFPRSAILDDYKDYGDEERGNLNPNYIGKGPNPYWHQYKDEDDDFRRRILGFAKATYRFNDWLSAFVRVGTDALTSRITSITPYGHFKFPLGQRSDNVNMIAETNTDFLFMLDKALSKDLRFSLNAGGNYKRGTSESMSVGGTEFQIPTKVFYNNLIIKGSQYYPPARSSIYSAYFSGTLDFKETVYLNFTGRNDWDSGMWTPTGEKSDYSFFYPSVSLSLLGNELLKLDKEGFLSYSKLRFSWAEVGSGGYKNDQIYYSIGSTLGYNGSISVSRSNTYDDVNLKPETTRSTELGLELQFLRNRLYADLTYYNSTTFDQIVNAPVDASTGYSFIRTNIGEVTNKGFELLVGGTPFKAKNFYWNTSINLARNKNVLESFIEGTNRYVFTSDTYATTVATVGGEYGDIYGRGFVYNDGQLVVDNQGLPVVSAKDQLLGNYQPDLTGGFSNTIKYKNLTFSALIDFRIGGEAYSRTEGDMNYYGVTKESLKFRESGIIEGVVNTGTAESPVYVANTTSVNAEQYFSRMQSITEAYIKDLTNVRLREITVGYDLPRSLVGNRFIENATISLVARNLFFFHKNIDSADPEATNSVSNFGQGIFYFNAPSNRSIGVNLNISF